MKEIKYLVMSDIHLGHNNTKTDFIIHNLKSFFLTYSKELKDIKIIFLAGDIFDRLLTTHSVDYILAYEWLMELYIYCIQHKISLRILEGTPSHDWKQATMFNSIIKKINKQADFKYIDTLYIERNIELGINILYIPDEYRPKSSTTYLEVLKLLKENNLEQVDIAIMHGQFKYQLPILLESSHDENDYLKIVKHFIHIGHIHTPSTFNRIIANGSFDRLKHGEEESKGAILVTLNDKNNNFIFLENKKAKIYKTIDFTTEEELFKTIKGLPKDSYIRLQINDKLDVTDNLLNKLKKMSLNVKLVINSKKEEEKKFLTDKTLDTFTITKDNISELVIDYLKKLELNDAMINDCIKLLVKYI